jgi:hypothetical protein
MATPVKRNNKGKTPDTTTEDQNQSQRSGEASTSHDPDSSNRKTGVKPTTILYSYSPDATPEFQARTDSFTAGAERSLVSALSRSALGESETLPFASNRSGDTITVVVPLTMVRGDALAELIMLLASKVPTCVLMEGQQGWEEPTWTAETSRQLMGFVSALQGAPKSFSSSSSPTDLTRSAVWITAANSALSRPGGAAFAHGSVLPTEVGGAKSASKYLTKVFASLRNVSSEPKVQTAIMTFERLLKMWIKDQYRDALDLVRRNRISWGTLLNAGSPTESKKVKGRIVKQIRSPPKPSRSPFLSGKERQELASLFAPAWNTPEQMRTEWNALSANDQHTQYSEYLVRLKQHYEDISKISSSIHSKLGHRKKWIHKACEERDVVPKNKKDKSNEFKWADAFFKLNAKDMNLSVALVFAPSHYLPDRYHVQDILSTLWDKDKVLTTTDAHENFCGVTVNLWKDWIQRFEPDLTINTIDVPEALSLEDDNPFADLPSEVNSA